MTAARKVAAGSGKGKRVVAAMSGGVDSSVTAALLVDQGYEVIGVTMQIWPAGGGAGDFGGCCGLDAIEDARRVAASLSIPHYVLNFRRIFAEQVIETFCREYLEGRTPNPCIRCNQFVKFDALLEKALQLDADYVATGHYARIVRDEASGRYQLHRAFDHTKDQSYVLYVMKQHALSHTLFPLGELKKTEVRKLAARFGLKVADKPESQEICFVAEDRYGEFLEGFVPGGAVPGTITDLTGKVLGEHRGILHYTVGQRKGLGLSSPTPLYVVRIERESNSVVVGEDRDLYERCLVASELNWIPFDDIYDPIRVQARIRYNAAEAPAVVEPVGRDTVEVCFDEPQRAIAPGQAVVFYDDDLVIGGGTILCSGPGVVPEAASELDHSAGAPGGD